MLSSEKNKQAVRILCNMQSINQIIRDALSKSERKDATS
jgi:hypothetical protein